ncbi:MAG: hypothetical protein AVO33_02640 [delta proteobacterium ML8_F1]|nr:MAG: hypothetical protein AVO33_02640 [delta proteobacterium ML8_F1]
MATVNSVDSYLYEEILSRDITGKTAKLRQSMGKSHSRSRILNHLLGVLFILVIFGAMAMLLYRYAEINEIKYSNFELKKEIQSLNVAVEELKYQLDSASNLKTIEHYATTQLGMQYPQPHQVVYIESGTKYALDIEKNENLGDNSPEVLGYGQPQENLVKTIIGFLWN